MKKVYLVHGWGGSSEGGWFDWLKLELKSKGYEVKAFDMPNTEEPKIEEWVGYLEANIKDVDEETYFVGYSIGCQTIIRFLEKLHKQIPVKMIELIYIITMQMACNIFCHFSLFLNLIINVFVYIRYSQYNLVK